MSLSGRSTQNSPKAALPRGAGCSENRAPCTHVPRAYVHKCTCVPLHLCAQVCPCTCAPMGTCTQVPVHPCTYTPCTPMHPCTPVPHTPVPLHPYIHAPMYLCTHTSPATPEPLNSCPPILKHPCTPYTGTRAPLYPVHTSTPAPHTHACSLQQRWRSQHPLPRGSAGCRAAAPSHPVPCDPQPRRYNYPLSSCSC